MLLSQQTIIILINIVMKSSDNSVQGFNINDIGNLADAINKKYNTFSLIEFVINDIEEYMQIVYDELKNVLLKKSGMTAKRINVTKPACQTKHNVNKSMLHKNSTIYMNQHQHKIGTHTTNYLNYSLNHRISEHSLNKTRVDKKVSTREIQSNGNTNNTMFLCLKNHSHQCNANTFTGATVNKHQNNTNKNNGPGQWNKNATSNNLRVQTGTNFMNRFVNNKIVNYYRNMYKKYGNASFYNTFKMIANNYFRAFNKEISNIRYNISSDISGARNIAIIDFGRMRTKLVEDVGIIKKEIVDDVNAMKKDLITLYYETTSTTESVDSLVVHYLENKTKVIETFVKRNLFHSKNNDTTSVYKTSCNYSSSFNNSYNFNKKYRNLRNLKRRV